MKTEYEILQDNLKELKLKELSLKLSETLDIINSQGLTFTQGLIRLTNYEIEYKEKSAIQSMVKTAGFPFRKELDDFDFEFQGNINKQQILEFTNHKFINEQRNIIFIGSSGVGKTHLATAIGISAAKKEYQHII